MRARTGMAGPVHPPPPRARVPRSGAAATPSALGRAGRARGRWHGGGGAAQRGGAAAGRGRVALRAGARRPAHRAGRRRAGRLPVCLRRPGAPRAHPPPHWRPSELWRQDVSWGAKQGEGEVRGQRGLYSCLALRPRPGPAARGATEWSYADAHCSAYVLEAMVGSQRMLVPDMASRKVEAAIERPAHAPARHGITMAEAVVEGLRTRRRRRARPSTQARSASTRAWSGGRCSRRRCCVAASTAARPRWTVRAPPPSGALQRGAPGLQVLGTDTAGVRPGAKLYR